MRKLSYTELSNSLKEFAKLSVVDNCLLDGTKVNDKILSDIADQYEWWVDDRQMTMVDVVKYTEDKKDYMYIDTVNIA